MHQEINLYLRIPKVKAQTISIKRIQAFYAGLVICLVLISVFVAIENRMQAKSTAELHQQLAKINEQLNQLSASIESSTATLASITQDLKILIEKKQKLLRELSGEDNLAELVDQMTALSHSALPQIQVTQFSLGNNGSDIRIVGNAVSGLSVMYYLHQLKKMPAFKKTQFADVNIAKDANSDLFQFAITSLPEVADHV